jgi:hypothetical protein
VWLGVGDLRRLLAGVSLGGLLVVAPIASGSAATSLSLEVTFSANGAISVTLPDGTPVRSASGAPTLIPAGYYMLLVSGPMAPVGGLPSFHLTGPGVNVLEHLNEGGVPSATGTADFLPSSTYTWIDDATPGAVYAFVSSAQVVGTPPAPPSSPDPSAPAPSQDYVGSAIVLPRARLVAEVSAAGKVTLDDKGKDVTSGDSWKSIYSCVEGLAGVCPGEWFGGLVVGLDEREHLLG